MCFRKPSPILPALLLAGGLCFARGGVQAAEAKAQAPLPPGALRRLPLPKPPPAKTGPAARPAPARPYHSLALAPGGKFLALGGADGKVHLMELGSGRVWVFPAHEGPVYDVLFSPDGKTLASAGAEGTARLWDWREKKALKKFKGHEGAVKALAFSPDGQRLVTASSDRTLKLWDVAGGRALHTFRGHGAGVDNVVFGPGGRLILSEAGDVTARLWDAVRLEPLRVLPYRDGDVAAVALSPDGRRGISSRGNQTWHVFDAGSGQDVLILQGHRMNGSCVRFHPDGRSVLTGARDGTIRQWDLWSGLELRRLQVCAMSVRDLALDEAGRQLFSLSDKGEVLVWNLAAPPPRPSGSPKRASPAPLDPKRAQALWEQLGARGYAQRTAAVHGFLDGGAAALPFLIERLPPAQAPDRSAAKAWIAQLGAERYGVREEASRRLRAVRTKVRSLLEEAAEAHPSPEVRRRARAILFQAKRASWDQASSKAIRQVLAVEILGWFWRRAKQAAARVQLEKLARGERESPRTRQAQAVLGRP